MLVLNQYVRETVIVNETRVTILEVRGRKVRLGFEGPDNVVRESLLLMESERHEREAG